MTYSETSSSLSLPRSVSTVLDVVMPCARRGGKAKALAAWADPNAQLIQESLVGTTVARPVDPTTTQVDDDPDGLPRCDWPSRHGKTMVSLRQHLLIQL